MDADQGWDLLMRTLEEFRTAIRTLDERGRECSGRLEGLETRLEVQREADQREAAARGRTQGLIWGGLISLVVSIAAGLILGG